MQDLGGEVAEEAVFAVGWDQLAFERRDTLVGNRRAWAPSSSATMAACVVSP